MNADDVQTPFNEFLKILIEQGVVGLLLFLCLLYFLLMPVIPRSSVIPRLTRNPLLPEALARNDVNFSSIILFILIFGLFSYPFDKLPFVALFVFSIAILSKDRNTAFAIQLRKPSYWQIPLFFTLCIVSCIIALNACNYAKSCRAWNRALMYYAFGKEESLLKLKNLYPDLENNPIFLITYGKALSWNKHYSEAATVLEKAVKLQPLSSSCIELGKCYEAKGLSSEALESWKRAGRMVPALFTPLYLTMKLHFKNEEYGKAQECAKQLLAKKIKIDNPEIDLMKREARDIITSPLPLSTREEKLLPSPFGEGLGVRIKQISCNEIYNILIKTFFMYETQIF